MSLKISEEEKEIKFSEEDLKTLFLAVQSGDLDFISSYLENGGDSNVFYTDDELSLLGAASYNGELEILKTLLLNGADPLYNDQRGNSVLMLSFLQDKNKEIYKELLGFEMDVNHENEKGQTALSMAVKSFNEGAVRALLEMKDLSDVNLQKSFFESVFNQDEEFMKIIYNKFSKVISLEDESGESALKTACKKGLTRSLKFLMDNQPEDLKNKRFLEEVLDFAKRENIRCFDFLTSA